VTYYRSFDSFMGLWIINEFLNCFETRQPIVFALESLSYCQISQLKIAKNNWKCIVQIDPTHFHPQLASKVFPIPLNRKSQWGTHIWSSFPYSGNTQWELKMGLLRSVLNLTLKSWFHGFSLFLFDRIKGIFSNTPLRITCWKPVF